MKLLGGVDQLRPRYDVAVVGAGPAGMAAATEAAAQGRSVLLVDENPAPGGQVYRAIGSAPLPGALGADYQAGAALAQALMASEAEYLPNAAAWHLDDALELGVSAQGSAAVVPAGRVVIATGALERPFPIEGWTLPGVMSVGAGQTLLKAQGMAPTGRVVLAGCGPLLWLYAAQCIAAGAPPMLVLETTPRENWRAALPHLPAFLRSPYLAKGLRLMARVRRAVRVRGGVTQLAVTQDSAGLRVRWNGGDVSADHLLLHQGVVPNLNLARAAGCGIRWDAATACFVPMVDALGNSSVPGIAVVGDGAGIAGAEAAALRGRLAVLPPGRAAPLHVQLARWQRGRPFLDALYLPAPQFRVAPDAAIACRCEEVTGAQVREAARLGATGPNQLKAFLRCGMGPCQGRLCGLTITETIAEARGSTPEEVGYLRLRSPVKPITLREFASMPRTPADLQAVERR